MELLNTNDPDFVESVTEFSSVEASVRDERELCRLDRRFCYVTGAQYEGKTKEQFKSKPKYEINKVALAVTKAVSEYRNNRITINFKSSTGRFDEIATQLNDVYRADTATQEAQEAFDTAYEEKVSGGIGAWRLRAVYVDEYDDENEEQKIVVEPITDAATSVYFNYGKTRCWVISDIGKGEYKDLYGDDPVDWPETKEEQFDWVVADTVRIAEYYKVEEVPHRVHSYTMNNGDVERFTDDDFENDKSLKAHLLAVGAKKLKTKTVRRRVIKKMILSGGGIVEDCGYIAGDKIPIVIDYGERAVVDRIERVRGKVRTAKDPMRIKNVITNKLVEFAAGSSVEKPILTPKLVGRYGNLWAKDSEDNYAYLLLEDQTDAEGNNIPITALNYTRVPNVPPNLQALIALTDHDINQLLGNHQEAEKIRANLSGDAIQQVRDETGIQNYIYISNHAKAKKESAEIWLGMARDIYIEEGRKLKALASDNSERFIEIGRPVQDENGQVVKEFDLSRSGFDVVSDIGPSTSSKRSKTLSDIQSFLQFTKDPETIAILTAMGVMNMEGDGVSDARSFFRKKLVGMGVIEPTKEEQEQIDAANQNQEPDANQEYLKAAAMKEQAQAEKLAADTAHVAAKTEETEAKTVETYASIDRDDLQAALNVTASQQQPTVTATENSELEQVLND